VNHDAVETSSKNLKVSLKRSTRSTSDISVLTWITTHLPTLYGWKAAFWPGWFTLSRHFTNEVVTCQPQIRYRSGKVREPKTDVVSTKPRRQSTPEYGIG